MSGCNVAPVTPIVSLPVVDNDVILGATTETFTSTDTWTAPVGVTSVDVECWGGGAAGAGATGSYNTGGGGGGGAYSKTTGISVTPSTGYDVIVGSGGSGGTGNGAAGGDSYFDDGSEILAKGGNGGSTTGIGGSGGAAASGVGITKYDGGDGANGDDYGTSNRSGGGGGGAGDAANGGDGTDVTCDHLGCSGGNPGSGGSADGGNGGNYTERGNGGNGSTLGGGGGGAASDLLTDSYSGGNGARGECRITYTPVLDNPFVSSATDSPDPVYDKQEIAFEVNWALGTTTSSMIKSKICKTDVLESGNCTGGFWATSTDFTATNPTTTKYLITESDFGTKNYYAYVCDDQDYCSSTSTAGTFLAIDDIPTVTSATSTSITQTGATLNGEVTVTNSATDFAIGFEYGIGAFDSGNFTATTTVESATSSIGIYSGAISSLTTFEEYGFRAYASTTEGDLIYGDTYQFYTGDISTSTPVVVTDKHAWDNSGWDDGSHATTTDNAGSLELEGSGSGGFTDGLSDFLTTWSGVHTAYSFNSTDANTGTDTSHTANSSSYSQAETGVYANYGTDSYSAPDASGDMDIYTITDAAMLLYIPDSLATGVYGLFWNGGGTNAQGAFIQSESNGTTVTLGISHNASGTNQDYTTYALSERGWVMVGFQFEDNSGNMAIWVNGVNEAEVARSYALLYGSGNPGIGDNNGDDIPGWSAESTINSSGIIIANFVVDNPNSTNTTPPGCGDDFYTDYYNEHAVAGGYEEGYWISPSWDVGSITNVDTSWLEIASTTPDDSLVNVAVGLNTSASVPPAIGDFATTTNLTAMTGVTGDLTGKYLWTLVWLHPDTAADDTPSVTKIIWAINESSSPPQDKPDSYDIGIKSGTLQIKSGTIQIK